MAETDLYLPVKTYLEAQGYSVKAEVKSCDVVARRKDEPPIIVELKLSFNLNLLLQGVDRLSMSDHVYLAFAAPSKNNPAKFWKKNRRDIIKLCRRVGLGLMSVETTRGADGFVEVYCDPLAYVPRKNKKRETLLLREFDRRQGDPNLGGSTKRPIITAYRQDALRCLAFLAQAENQAATLKAMREHTGVERASAICQRDVYGWFERLSRGTYGLSEKAHAALVQFDDQIKCLRSAE